MTFEPLTKERKNYLESRFDGIYDFVEQIGVGSFSNVYRAYLRGIGDDDENNLTCISRLTVSVLEKRK